MPRRYRRLQQPGFDPTAGLGPGDPGYRTRAGRTGLDPYESILEAYRVIGILIGTR
jgi:hypothetical protein